jgi:Adenylate and Guanylate cyclase catalytic domain
MNTCSRIESTGERNRIHMSQETAEILAACGKGHWCRKRDDYVVAKGKGVLSTFWLEARGDSGRSAHSSSQGTDEEHVVPSEPHMEEVCLPSSLQGVAMPIDGISQKTLRLARWNSDILLKKLCKVVARREALQVKPAPKALMHRLERNILESKTMTMDEVKDVVGCPSATPKLPSRSGPSPRSTSARR